MLNIADLLAQENIATIRARMRDALAADGFPVDSWAPSAAGGVENMRLDMAAGIGAYMPPRIVDIVNGRFLPLATGDWLTSLAAKFYGLTRFPATPTIENVGLYAVGNVSYTFTPGALWVRADESGHRYLSIDGGSFSQANSWTNFPLIISPSVDNPLMLRFQAENPGSAYADRAGSITTLVTARAGVRCINLPPADYLPATVNGSSTGTIVATIVRPTPFLPLQSIRVQVTASGQVGAAAFRYSADGGASWSTSFTVVPAFDVTGAGTATTRLAFADGGVSPSFLAGDTFTLLLGDAILQRGNDAETDAALRRRCSNRWPSLSDVPVAATVELWARQASPEIARVAIDADPNTPGGMQIRIASASGPASPAAQIAVSDYVNARLWGYRGMPAATTAGFTSPAETATVLSATAFNVVATGPVRVPKARLAGAQVAANNAWNAYLADLPLGGLPGAAVELAELAKILADAGAIDVPRALANLQINGVSGDATIPVGDVAVPAAGQSLLTSITWVPV